MVGAKGGSQTRDGSQTGQYQAVRANVGMDMDSQMDVWAASGSQKGWKPGIEPQSGVWRCTNKLDAKMDSCRDG